MSGIILRRFWRIHSVWVDGRHLEFFVTFRTGFLQVWLHPWPWHWTCFLIANIEPPTVTIAFGPIQVLVYPKVRGSA